MPYVSHNMTFGGKTVILADPKQYPEAREANSYSCPVGVYAGRGSVLMLKTDLEAIAHVESHQLVIDYVTYSFRFTSSDVPEAEPTAPDEFLFVVDELGQEVVDELGRYIVVPDPSSAHVGTPGSSDVESETETHTFGPFYITNNRRLGFSSAGDDAVYLVEFADRRILAERFSDSETKQFNLHSYADDPDKKKYLYGTVPFPKSADAKQTPHEWSTVVEKLWPQICGPAPELPYNPVSTPDDLQWYGCNPWTEALPAVMDRLGCDIVLDPVANTFSIVRRGDAQDDFPELPTHLYSADTVDAMKVDAPENVAIYQHDWGVNYGTERDTGTGVLDNQWLLGPPFERTELNATEGGGVASGTAGISSVMGTVKPVWIDAKREYGLADTEIEEEKKTEAQYEIKEGIYRDAAIARAHKVYAGIHLIKPGSEVKAVAWYDRGSGIRTEYTQHPGPPARKGVGQHLLGCNPDDNFDTLDVASSGFPTYPHTDQLIKVEISAPEGAPGEDENPLPEKVFEARVCKVQLGAVVPYEQCYLRLMDEDGEGDIQSKDGDFYLGRLMGAFSGSQGVRPFYVARKGATGSTPDSRVKLVRVLDESPGATVGSILSPVADCAYNGVILTAAVDPDFCGNPFTESTAIWVAKLVGGPSQFAETSDFYHVDEFVGYRLLESFTPYGEAARPLYVVRPDKNKIGVYRAEIESGYDRTSDFFTVEIKEVISKGTEAVGATGVSVTDTCNIETYPGSNCIVIEKLEDDPTVFYAIEVTPVYSGLYLVATTSAIAQNAASFSGTVTTVLKKGSLNATDPIIVPNETAVSTKFGGVSCIVREYYEGGSVQFALVEMHHQRFGLYNATAQVDFDSGDDTFAVDIDEVLVRGTLANGTTGVTVQNNWYDLSGSSGDNVFVLEYADATENDSTFVALVTKSAAGSGGHGLYHGHATEEFSGGSDFNAQIDSVIVPGTKSIGETVSISNLYGDAGTGTGAGGVKCLIVETPTAFLASAVEKRQKDVYVDDEEGFLITDDVGGNKVIRLEKSIDTWVHYGPEPNEEDDITLVKSMLVKDNETDPVSLSSIEIYHLGYGATGPFATTTLTVTGDIKWDEAHGDHSDIVVPQWTITVFAKTALDDQIVHTENC